MYRSAKLRAQRVVVTIGVGVAAVAAGTGASVLVLSLGGHSTSARTTVSQRTITSSSAPPNDVTSATAAPPVALSSSTIAVTPSIVIGLSTSSITVQNPSGAALSYSLTPTTTVLEGHTTVSASHLAVGERVFVVPALTSSRSAGTIGILPAATGDDSGGGGDN